MKRIFAIITLTLLFADLCICVGQPDQKKPGVVDMFREFGVLDVDTIPSGITPIEISNPGELKRFLHGISNSSKSATLRTSDISLVEDADSESLVETYVETLERKCINPIFRTYFNLWGEIWISGSGSFWQITDAYEWVGLTGPTYYVALSNAWHYTYISSDRTTATIRGGGILDYYFVFESVFRIASYPISLTDRFSLYGL